MKKFVFLVLMALVASLPMLAQSLQPTILLQSTGEESGWGYFKLACDGTKIYNTTVEVVNLRDVSSSEKIGDLMFTIYNGDFGIAEQFTIKDVYKQTKREGQDYYNTVSDYDDIEVLGNDMPDVLLTKGVFSNDGKWNVIIRVDGPEKGIDYVYSQDGAVLGDLSMINGSLYFVFGNAVNGKLYLVGTKNSYPQYSITVYSFTGQNSLSNPAVVSRKLSAYPNPLPQGAMLTIEMGREAVEGTFVTFSDMQGRLIDKVYVADGMDSFAVSPRSIARGAYIYTVYFGDGEVASGKIIAE